MRHSFSSYRPGQLPIIRRSWFALILGILIMSLIIAATLLLLEKIVPTARSTRGIENANVAYYHAYGAIENSFLAIAKHKDDASYGTSGTIGTTEFSVVSTGTTMPLTGRGNSELDSDYDMIGPGAPVQVKLGTGLNMNFKITAKVPNFNNPVPELNFSDSTWMIRWTLTTNDGITSLSSSWEENMIMKSELGTPWNIFFKDWIDPSGSGSAFDDFYANNCTNDPCTLKLSVARQLLTKDNEVIPYLEYKIDFWGESPLSASLVDTSASVGGFLQNIHREFRRMVSNVALDFAVFQ